MLIKNAVVHNNMTYILYACLKATNRKRIRSEEKEGSLSNNNKNNNMLVFTVEFTNLGNVLILIIKL